MRKIVGTVKIDGKEYRILEPPRGFELELVDVGKGKRIVHYVSKSYEDLYDFLVEYGLEDLVDVIYNVMDEEPSEDIKVRELRPVDVIDEEGNIKKLEPPLIGSWVGGVAIDNEELWVRLPPNRKVVLHELLHTVLYRHGISRKTLGLLLNEIICDLATECCEFWQEKFDFWRYYRISLDALNKKIKEKYDLDLIQLFVFAGDIPPWISEFFDPVDIVMGKINYNDWKKEFLEKYEKKKFRILSLEIKRRIVEGAKYSSYYYNVARLFFRESP